jgi:DNA-binding NtrC family response regulator
MRIMIVGPLSGRLGEASRIARDAGAALEHADTVDNAIHSLARGAHVELVFCDVSLPIGELLEYLQHQRHDIFVIACGTNAQADEAVAAIKAGAREYLPLPPDPLLIAAILHEASRDRHTPIARDPAMLAVLKRADQIARTDASVLLTGASGTGKEVMARFVHSLSRRAKGPFVGVNCAAIPETMLESELFGHEKGAFSGAVSRRIGKFEMADGGTLLLDEISEMDVRIQAKLLRAIQEREIDRLGGGKPVRVDVRIIATSNRLLATEIAAGRFREDLYFRLNVVNLRLPSLAERPTDIPGLAEHFAEHYAKLNGVPSRRLTAEAIQCLLRAPWPGNVRELENTIHRAVLLSEGSEIGPEALDLDMPGSRTISTSAGDSFVGRRIEDVERDLILTTLSHTNGNRTHAAVMLGISIRALRNKLRDYAQSGMLVPPPLAGAAA